jgi:penicillin amidase
MKRVSKALKIGSLTLLVLLLVAVAGGVWFVRRPWPEISGQLQMPGLQAPVRIVRDTWGVPHIFAENEHDLFMAQGYVHAQDRLWQMEWNRNIANGTLATLIGDAGVAADQFTRTMGTLRSAQSDYQLIDPEERTMLDNYSAGVNAYIESHRNRLPLQYTLLGVTPRPWTPIDSLAFGNVISFSLQGNHRLELLRARLLPQIGEEKLQALLPMYESNKPLIIPQQANGYRWLSATSSDKEDYLAQLLGDPNASWGSNNWVVSGSRTTTGKPILANDTHLNQSMPSIWYQNGLHGGRFNTVGYTRAGVPLVLIGHTERVAWGITNLNPDVQDLYIEKFDNRDNPTQVEFNNAWEPLTIIPETIQVKGKDPISFNVYVTRHGPIVNDVIDTRGQTEPLALSWAAYGSSTIFHSIVLLNQASNWDEFRNAIRYWDLPSQNFVYADVDGNIGYQASGKVPIRAPQHQGTVPVPGWTGEYEWKGLIPFEELPYSFNPPEGFIGTANNKIVDDSYPYSLAAEWDPGYRARRIIDLLQANDKVSVEYVKQMQADTYSLPAEALMPYLRTVQPQSDLERRGLPGLVPLPDAQYDR